MPVKFYMVFTEVGERHVHACLGSDKFRNVTPAEREEVKSILGAIARFVKFQELLDIASVFGEEDD